MRVFIFFAVVLTSISGFSQMSADVPEEKGINSIIGVVTSNPDDFYKVKNLLEITDGVDVLDFCFQDKLLSISFNPKFFQEESQVFDLITSYYVDAKCFRKTMSKETYNQQCKNEVVKQKMK